MRMHNRIPDIKKLQSNALQDFFRLETEQMFSEEDDKTWKKEFYDLVERNYRNKSYAARYIGAWNKINMIGIENYDFKDMDTTIIVAIHFKGSPFTCDEHIVNRMYDLREDRNYDAHTTNNEDESELVQFAFGALQDLQRFIDSVSRFMDIKLEDKKEYCWRYSKRIKDLRNCIAKDYEETIGDWAIISREVEYIKSSSNIEDAYWKVWEKYFVKKEFKYLHEIAVAAEKMGVHSATEYCAYDFYRGFCCEKDLKRAGEYYEKVMTWKTLSPMDELNLANIYINGIFGKDKQKKGYEIIEKMKKEAAKEGISIIKGERYISTMKKRMTDDGLIEYERCLQKIE